MGFRGILNGSIVDHPAADPADPSCCGCGSVLWMGLGAPLEEHLAQITELRREEDTLLSFAGIETIETDTQKVLFRR